MPESAPKVSVIIPSFNDATYINRLLEALTRQTGIAYEVIVSDAESQDKIREVAAVYALKLPLRLVQSPPKGPAAGRNYGAKFAHGEWLLFLDADDDIDDPRFIATLVNEAINHGWQTASSKMKVVAASVTERAGTWLNYKYTKLLSHTKHPVAGGWCILTKRDIFIANHGFNENIQFGEDYDYVSRTGYAGFGFTEKTFYYLDLRRAREEGWRFAVKCIANEIYRFTHKFNLEKNKYKYEFGTHKERKD